MHCLTSVFQALTREGRGALRMDELRMGARLLQQLGYRSLPGLG